MASRKSILIFVYCLMLILAACDEPTVLPTSLPVAAVPTIEPTAEPFLPPTLDLTATINVLAPTPASTPTAAATAAPTSTPIAAQPSINITSPGEDSELVMGSTIIAQGLLRAESNQTAWLSLISYSGLVLAEAPGVANETGWQSGLGIPQTVGGVAFLQASIRDLNGEIVTHHTIPVHLVLDAESTDRYLSLFRPQPGDPAMGGFNLFFDGRAQRPVNNTVTISVWADDCRTQVARQSFVLSGSGYWQGFVIIPQTVAGPGCAIAHFGTPGEESWREVQVPIEIAAVDDSSAKGIRLGNPPPGRSVIAGGELLLYGTALNQSEGTIQVTIMLENGRIITENLVSTDYWGYWEFPAIFPLDIDGPAEITVTAGRPGTSNFAEDKVLITIEPAPTPSP